MTNAIELDPARETRGAATPKYEGFGGDILLYNAWWFVQVRWVVVAVLLLAGLAGWLLPALFKCVGLVPPAFWPWKLAAALALTNVLYMTLMNRLREDSPQRAVEYNLYLQILADLVILTILVHIVGGTDTFMPFTYLFHIVLACIFFPASTSLLLTLFAAACYLVAVALELAGLWPAQGMFARTAATCVCADDVLRRSLFAGSALFVWGGVWYLVSHLAEAVRRRDKDLRAANARLIRAEEDMNRQVLFTTHELKAPFAGILSNIDLLKLEHWDTLSEPIRELIRRIDARALALTERIRDILTLGDLKSRGGQETPLEPVALHEVLQSALDNVRAQARDRRVTLDVQSPPATVRGHPGQLACLFTNLLANAVLYSREGGHVRVISRPADDWEWAVAVSDQGIGIPAAALPRIFDEYFRVADAVRFNKLSTGLGLAIVRQVARNLKLRVRVESAEGQGSTFEVFIPTT